MILKTIHEIETGDPERIKYKGKATTASFRLLSGNIAELESLGTYDIDDDVAWVDVDELQEVITAVENIQYVNGVTVIQSKKHNNE